MPSPEEAKTQKFVSDWMDDIRLGLKYKDKFSDHKEWGTYRDQYRGNFGDSQEDTIVNRVYSVLRSMIPRIYFRSPNISCTARIPEKVPHSRIVESVDNWLILEMNLKKQFKRAIFDACLCGTGVLKLGYDSEYGFLPEQGVALNYETATQVGVGSGEVIEYNVGVQPGMPWVQRVRPDDVITPYGYSDPDDLPWVVHMFIRPLEDCKDDQKYDAEVRKDLKGGFSSLNSAEGNKFTLDNERNKFCLLYEIRDYKTKQLIVISEDKLLLKTTDTLQLDGLPFEFIIFNEDPEHFWGLSDVKMLNPQQKELNEVRTQASRMRRQNLIKFLYQKGAFTPENLEKLLSSNPDDIGVGVEVNAESLQAAIFPMQPHNLTTELIRDGEVIESDLRDTVGYSQNQMGEYVPFHNKTAKEASIVDHASGIRSDERRDLIADTLSRVMRKVNQMLFTFWTSERITNIVGPEGRRSWVTYTGEALRGEYTLIVNPEDGQPVTRATRQQTAIEIFKMLNNDPLIDQLELRKMALKETDNVDPSYQTLVRMPEQQAPQGQGEMPGMPGMPAAGQPTPGPQQAQADPRMEQLANLKAQQMQQGQQMQMQGQKHSQQLAQSQQKHQLQLQQMAQRSQA